MTKEAAIAIMQRRNSPEDRFVLRAKRITESHGGMPTTTIEDGKLVFTYPDGTRTSGGQRI
jgi:hypothetical protein